MGSGRKVAVIGAGLCGLKCANELENKGISVTVFEKSRGIGGRLANRRTRAGLTFDHGAQYVTARNQPFIEYLTLAIENGFAANWVFCDAGDLNSKKIRIVGTNGMSDLARPLSQGLQIHFETEIKNIQKTNRKWILNNGHKNDKQEFDLVVLAVPAPQAALLVPDSKDVISELENIEILPCLAAMVTFSKRIETPYDTLSSDTGVLAWAARNSSKPCRDPVLDSWVLHGSPGWSANWLEADRDTIAEKLTQAFASKIEKPLPETIYTVGHKWRYALTSKTLGKDYLASRDNSLFVGGDWCSGARAESAFESGKAMAEHIIGL